MDSANYPYLAQYRYDQRGFPSLVEMELNKDGYEIEISGQPFDGMYAIVLEIDYDNEDWVVALLGGRKYIVHSSALLPL